MKISLLCCTVFSLLCFSCIEVDAPIVYKIAKGEHYSTPALVQTIDKNPVVFYATFDETAIYESDGDINKLYGFTDCNSSVHENSARFGWRWYDNSLQIFSYVYCNGTRSFTYITTVELNKSIRYKIDMQPNGFIFSVNGAQVTEKRCNDCNTGVYMMLRPYFGGDAVSPHNIYIEIK